MEEEFRKSIAYIEYQLSSAGYEPYAQLCWFVRTQDPRYITRQGNARQLIMQLDMAMLTDYVMQMQEK